MGSRVNWSQAIKSYRQTRLLKQSALADELRVDRSRISRWERGQEEPGPAMKARLRSLMAASTPKVDDKIRQIIETTPHLMQLMHPDTRNLAASIGLARIAQWEVERYVGYYDIFDMSEELVAQFDRLGGVASAHQNALRIDSCDVWMENGESNKAGPLRIQSTALRLVTDDDMPVFCVSTRIVTSKETAKPLDIQWL